MKRGLYQPPACSSSWSQLYLQCLSRKQNQKGKGDANILWFSDTANYCRSWKKKRIRRAKKKRFFFTTSNQRSIRHGMPLELIETMTFWPSVLDSAYRANAEQNTDAFILRTPALLGRPVCTWHIQGEVFHWQNIDADRKVLLLTFREAHRSISFLPGSHMRKIRNWFSSSQFAADFIDELHPQQRLGVHYVTCGD